MTFLCPGYPDRGLSPGPGLVAGHAAPGEAMRAAGVLAGSGRLRPGGASKLVRVTDRRADVGDGPPRGSGPQRQKPHHRDPRPRRPSSLVPTRPLTCVQA